ncbi:hypothetical protein [Aeromicrobium sp. CF3.5]|uniref:hypothetical protein n=1 Tax=Aeromicrobium sp. CF3.5 TaxID=3373078 RepID=UPI003EE4C419
MSANEPPPYPGDDSANNPPPHAPPPAGPPSDQGLPDYGSAPPPPAYGSGPGAMPPPPPGGPIVGYEAPAAFGYGWKAFKANAGQLVLTTVLIFAVAIVLSLITEAVAPSPDFVGADGGFAFEGGELLLSFVAQTILGAVVLLPTAAMIRGCLDICEGRKFSLGDAFSRISPVPIIITGIIVSLLTSIGFVLLVLPGIIVSIFSFFAIYFVVDRDESPIKAIGSSFAMVGSNFGSALLSGLLAFLILIAGTLALVVGLLVAIPITVVAGAYAFKSFSGQPVAEVA